MIEKRHPRPSGSHRGLRSAPTSIPPAGDSSESVRTRLWKDGYVPDGFSAHRPASPQVRKSRRPFLARYCGYKHASAVPACVTGRLRPIRNVTSTSTGFPLSSSSVSIDTLEAIPLDPWSFIRITYASPAFSMCAIKLKVLYPRSRIYRYCRPCAGLGCLSTRAHISWARCRP